jgi:hypothetical protein
VGILQNKLHQYAGRTPASSKQVTVVHQAHGHTTALWMSNILFAIVKIPGKFELRGSARWRNPQFRSAIA